MPSSLFVTDAIWQVKADKCDREWLTAHYKNYTDIFYLFILIATRKVLDVQHKKCMIKKLWAVCLPPKPQILQISAMGQTLPQVWVWVAQAYLFTLQPEVDWHLQGS